MSRPAPDDALDRLLDHHGIEAVVRAYADVVSRRAWPELAGLFRPDAEVVVDTRRGEPAVLRGPDALGSFIDRAITRFGFFEFVPLNLRVELWPGGAREAATGRLWMCEVRTDAADPGAWSTAFGVYHDRFVRHDGRWWFAGRRYHSLARRGTDPAVFPFPGSDEVGPDAPVGW